MKKLFRMVLIVLSLVILFVAVCNIWVNNSTKSLIYKDISQIPEKNTGLVLGTSKYLKGGSLNLFFKYRMEAAAKLYHAGKIKYLILSGDNSTKDYNEPAQMQKDLLKLGVPDDVMTLDYAGLRTFDSMLRCRDVFNQDDIMVISQEFHDARAIFICKHYEIEAIGFAAKDVPEQYAFKTNFREYFARTKMILDLYVLNTVPKYAH